MARKTIRDFSGGLVSYQSELDISDSQFQEFDNAINTKRGSITKVGTSSSKSAALSLINTLLRFISLPLTLASAFENLFSEPIFKECSIILFMS